MRIRTLLMHLTQEHSRTYNPSDRRVVVRDATEEDLTITDNRAYMRLKLNIADLRTQNLQLETSKETLEHEITALKARCQALEYVKKLILC
jgi:hypothetical protein